jgi:hypothetical protein
MTVGSHLSVRHRRREANWAALVVLGRPRPPEAGLRASKKKRAGPRGLAGLSEDMGQKQRSKKEGKEILLLFSKELTKLEFKHKFEFKQIKTMQQHVCNSKLL